MKPRLHGARHLGVQRLTSLILLISAGVLTLLWAALMIMQLAGVHFVVAWATEVRAVFFISLWANFATHLDQFCASLAALFAANAHHDSEAVHAHLTARTTDGDQ